MNTLCIKTLLGTAIACVASLACSEGSVDIGEDNPQAAKTGLAAYAGTWNGYVEAYTFEYGTSDRVRLVMDEQGQGQLRFGELDIIAKPTDQTVQYYPPQAENLKLGIGTAFVFEGFNYSLQGSRIETARIRTGAASVQIYADYCSIQSAPYPYRKLDSDLSVDDPWTVDYSKPPVTFAGLEHLGGTANIVVFDHAPTTVEQLSTSPTHSFPGTDYSGDDQTAFNLKHPDYPLSMAQTVPSICVAAADGTCQLSAELAGTVDIGFDAALGDEGNTLTGSLTIPSMATTGEEVLVRTVRMSRVN